MNAFDPYTRLANAIISQACIDYRAALRAPNLAEVVRVNGYQMNAHSLKAGCEKFFRSRWFEELTDVDGEKLMNLIQEDFRNDNKRF